MPPKKRALGESDSNVQPPSKRTATEKASDNGIMNVMDEPAPTEPSSVQRMEEMDAKRPEDYICINRPLSDFEAQDAENGEDECDDETEFPEDSDEEPPAFAKYRKGVEGPESLFSKPAADHPDWKWIMLWEAWTTLCDLRTKQGYVNPDNFNMHVYNDFFSYGINMLVENLILDFNKEYRKKKGRSLKHMWAVLAALGHWFQEKDPLETFVMMDDAARVDESIRLIGCAFLSILDAIDGAGQLKPDSEFHDLGLVISIYLDWSRDLSCRYSIAEDGEDDWRETVVAYAKKAGIDLQAVGCHATTKAMEEFEDVEPLAGKPKHNRWNWSKLFKAFKDEHGFGYWFMGVTYDITKWPRHLRAQYNMLGNTDPLAEISVKDLLENNIQVA